MHVYVQIQCPNFLYGKESIPLREFQINTWWRMGRGDLMAYTWFIGFKEDDFIIQTETLDSQRTH